MILSTFKEKKGTKAAKTIAIVSSENITCKDFFSDCLMHNAIEEKYPHKVSSREMTIRKKTEFSRNWHSYSGHV